MGKTKTGNPVARSGDLKRELVRFGMSPDFEAERLRVLLDTMGSGTPAEEHLINAIDHFLLQHRLADGRTVLEHFVETHPELPADDREMLLGWRHVVEGLFEVDRREGGCCSW